VGEGALDGDRIAALNKNWQALEQEGRLVDIICRGWLGSALHGT